MDTCDVPEPEWTGTLQPSDQESREITRTLAGVDIFSSLSPRELRLIKRIVHRRTYHSHEVIVRQGTPGLGMYMIQSGSAKVLLEAGDGRITELATLGPHQFFGEMSLLLGAPRAASVVAAERSEIIGFFQADLLGLSDRWPELGFRIIYRLSQVINQRLNETKEELKRVRQAVRKTSVPAEGDMAGFL